MTKPATIKKQKQKLRQKKAKREAGKSNKKHKKLGLAKFLQPSKPKKQIVQQAADDEYDEIDVKPTNKGTKENQAKSNLKDDVSKISKKDLSLVDRCKLQMSSSLLRLMDESLYTSDTKHIPIDKDKFLAYHEAYASVCDKWPTKPIDYIVKFIKKRLLTKKPLNKWKFADIGCGKEPLLKMKLGSKANVQSFDLVSAHKDIIEANMERLPLDSGSVSCVVYSLSLMAKNLGSIILEGKRVLKTGGSMLIVEVTSRFEGQERRFIGRLEKIGLKQKSSSTLPPNAYFTFFHFTKVNSDTDYSNSVLNIQLKPCVYKAR